MNGPIGATQDPGGGTSAEYASVEVDPTSLDLHAALRSLSYDDRRLLALRHVGGLSSNEMGALLHSSAPAIRMRLSRLHARLRRELRDD